MLKIKEKLNSKVSKSMWSLWAILIGMFVITGIVDPYFFSIPSLGVTLQLAAPLGLLAAGQTICMLT
jgi:ribose transport system permease protein